MKNRWIISILVVLSMGYVAPLVLAERVQHVQLTCFDREIVVYKFVLGKIDATTGFRVEELDIRGSEPYVLMRNPQNEKQYQELIWSAGWQCLLVRRTKDD